MLQRIRLGLEDYEQNVKRERYTSVCELGFEDDVEEPNISLLSDKSSSQSLTRLEKVSPFNSTESSHFIISTFCKFLKVFISFITLIRLQTLACLVLWNLTVE